jgi:hypothetical protein
VSFDISFASVVRTAVDRWVSASPGAVEVSVVPNDPYIEVRVAGDDPCVIRMHPNDVRLPPGPVFLGASGARAAAVRREILKHLREATP